jgi:hypothetical protein
LVRVPIFCFAALLLAPAVARAQADLFSRETIHGVADLRISAADADHSWLDGGQGKSGVGDGTQAAVPRAAVVWTPSLGFALRGHVTVQYEAKASRKLDINEAYLTLRAPPMAFGRAELKAGIFYPPVSLEHTGTGWTTPDMLSGSAINSWIGEEVLVRGVEGTFRHDFGEHEVSATAAVFGWNDTAGTLLSFRGWALHGLTTGLDTEWKLPTLSPFMRSRQYDGTTPVLELDHRPGYYGRLAWRPPAPISLSVVHYDNGGSRVALDRDLQWAWETRFTDVGLRWEPDGKTRVLAQAMTGETRMGFPFQGTGPIWINVGYKAAYVLVRRQLGADALTARLDGFRTSDRTLQALDDNSEHGWAITAAWRRHLIDHLDVITEAQRIDSVRAYRQYEGRPPQRDEILLQTALRVSF